MTQTGAQGAPPASFATDTSDIIVTAQKRSERLQDVPIAVSAFSGETLKEQRIESGNQLNQYVPNFSFNRANYGETNFQIRGVGFQLATASGDTGVGVHENNVPLGVNRLADADFYDLERIEVLRGPQGTLYGRNATGGVVNLITAKPTKRLEGSATMDVGSYGTMRLQGFLNVPIADWLQVRAAGTLLKRSGFQTNIDNGRDL
ncbi:MAG: TonB-dependent receptor, partial [Alphaproteobacteria bacterium]